MLDKDQLEAAIATAIDASPTLLSVIKQSAQTSALSQNPKSELALCTLEVFDTLPSTNRYLVESAKGVAEQQQPVTSHICVTDRQTAGVGRRGKQWLSGESSITFSIRHRFDLPAARLSGLSLVVGLIVCEVLAKVTRNVPQVKWPNDVLLGGQKLAGILIELPSSSGDKSICVTGIGINYKRNPTHGEVDQPLTTLDESSATLGSREEVIGRIAVGVLESFHQFQEHGWPFFQQRYAEHSYLRGKMIDVLQGTKSQIARVVDVDAQGGLIVNIDGVEKTLFSGEVSVRVQA